MPLEGHDKAVSDDSQPAPSSRRDLDVRGMPYPFFVDHAGRERWDVIVGLVAFLSAFYEGGRADQRFCAIAARSLYFSSIPT